MKTYWWLNRGSISSILTLQRERRERREREQRGKERERKRKEWTVCERGGMV